MITFVFKLLWKGLLSSIFTQACDTVRAQTAMEGTAFVHTSRMPKPVITFVFKGNPETRCTVSSLKQISVVCLGQRPHNRTGKVVALSKSLSHSHGQGCSKPGNICSGPSRGPEKQRGKRREGRRSRKAHQKAKKKRPSAQPVPESQEEAMSLEGKIALLEKNGNQGLAQR